MANLDASSPWTADGSTARRAAETMKNKKEKKVNAANLFSMILDVMFGGVDGVGEKKGVGQDGQVCGSKRAAGRMDYRPGGWDYIFQILSTNESYNILYVL